MKTSQIKIGVGMFFIAIIVYLGYDFIKLSLMDKYKFILHEYA
jgi:hypothetical protein